MIGVRSNPMLVWLWRMSAVGVSEGNHAIRLVPRPEQPVAAPVQPSRRDDRQPAVDKRLGQRQERRRLVDLRRQRQQRVAVDLRQTIESRHRALPGDAR